MKIINISQRGIFPGNFGIGSKIFLKQFGKEKFEVIKFECF